MAKISQTEGEQRFRGAFAFDRTLVYLAKGFVLDRVVESTDTKALLDAFPKLRGVAPLDELIADTDHNFEERCREAANYWTHKLAVTQALLELVLEGRLVEEGARMGIYPSQPFRPPVGHGGTQGAYTLTDLSNFYPSRVRPGLFGSARTSAGRPVDYAYAALLTAIKGADPEVTEAAEYAVECLRRDLYLPAVVMLGKVAEGALRELLEECSRHLLPPLDGNLTKFLASPFNGFSQVLKKAQDTLTHGAIAPVVDKNRLAPVWPWAEVLRLTRNTVHFGVRPPAPVDFGMASTLFIAASECLTTLYQLRAAVGALP